jgi:hypothetical protein
MMNFTDEHPGETVSHHVDHAAVIRARMPTADECARGYAEGAPVLVVSNGITDKVFPCWVQVTVDGPHGTPEPDAVAQAAVYVLGIISERLDNLTADVDDLAGAFGRSPCSVVEQAGTVREEEAASWRCADPGLCVLACPAAVARDSGRAAVSWPCTPADTARTHQRCPDLR